MSQSVRLWIETTHHAAFRYGGWGIAREIGGMVTGQAGGERATTAARIDLNALIAAFQGLPPEGRAQSRSTAFTTPGWMSTRRMIAMSCPCPFMDRATAMTNQLPAGRPWKAKWPRPSHTVCLEKAE